jgi:hypothetical protein
VVQPGCWRRSARRRQLHNATRLKPEYRAGRNAHSGTNFGAVRRPVRRRSLTFWFRADARKHSCLRIPCAQTAYLVKIRNSPDRFQVTAPWQVPPWSSAPLACSAFRVIQPPCVILFVCAIAVLVCILPPLVFTILCGSSSLINRYVVPLSVVEDRPGSSTASPVHGCRSIPQRHRKSKRPAGQSGY